MVSYSQAGQDEFVRSILGENYIGFYLEIGASYPIDISNTYGLELAGWKGVSFDNDVYIPKLWQASRTNPLIITDATTFDFTTCGLPEKIDYLSLDIDQSTTLALQRLLKFHKNFSVITIEHDAYRFGDLLRAEQREILHGLGYKLVRPNVSHKDSVFEDWWTA